MTRAAARVVLADGTVALVRPVGPDDVEQVRRLHESMSEQERYFRFFGALSPEALRRFVERLLDGGDAHGLMLGVFVGDRLVGVGHFVVLAHPEEAEVAFVVASDLHARGVATLLLEHLVSAARRRGVRRFAAEVLVENAAMLRVFTDSGLRCHTRRDGSTVHVELVLDTDQQYQTWVSDRERVADVASLRFLLRPSCVAVVGAGRDRSSVGNAVFRKVLAAGFRGNCYPVNRHARTVESLPAFADVEELPEVPDLVVVCVPAEAVPQVAESCGRKGVRALVVVSAGVTSDPVLAHGLVDAVRRWGMRLVGPNCLGVINTDPDVRLDATFTSGCAPAGDVGVITQSGGVGIALLDGLAACGLGVSSVVSVGDKYDVSGNDMLLWWQRDERTRLAVVYLESFGNPRKFSWLSRRMARGKPVIVLKSGASPVAQAAAASHTAASATPGTTRDALLRQSGAIGVQGLHDLFATVCLLRWQPLPKGGRVAVLGNAGGLAALAAEACADRGLRLPELSSALRAELASVLPGQASTRNPVDTTAQCGSAGFAQSLRALLRSGEVNSVVVVVTATAVADPLPVVADTAAEAQRGQEFGKPVLVVRAGHSRAVDSVTSQACRVPVFSDPAVAARALAGVSDYARWRLVPPGVVPDLVGVDAAAAREVVASAIAEDTDGWLGPDQVQRVLTAFGLPAVPTTVCADEVELLAAFRSMTGRVVVKAWVPGLVHKERAGGVVLDVTTVGEVRSAWSRLHGRFGEALHGVLLQPMVEPGREFLVGVHSDSVFGPVVVFGLGGVDTDVVADRSHRLVPLTDRDAAAMLGELRSSAALFGERSVAALDTAALTDVSLRTARMAELLPEVTEVDLNPVVVTGEGACIADARIRVRRREPDDPLIRRLRL
ncbi:GNAT family N-acetyltransferase [Saccharopolyspora erythraea]|uniref:Acyl-CoA synthetase (NDP forming type) n=2 Tax=Saccharopolyspora erythraea TaxID=1836 RepID=A4FCG4_SACEN|nr:GNAT family N-acetyltransferase [Saccharopolyspora erythraea]QRK92129.1 GNAT family N-acetyltransferase [Saccharopolyspora erythraea]CAM01739.1 acyl-CoA synthetase (NDP forming type) [Saccharopolyspora erythraea NRRL 2338]